MYLYCFGGIRLPYLTFHWPTLAYVDGEDMSKKSTLAPQSQRAGWSVQEWCASAAISDALFYKLETQQRPASVKIGAKRIITEAPAAWLARVGQSAPSTV